MFLMFPFTIQLPRKTMAERIPLSVEVNKRSHSADGKRKETHLK